MINFNSRMSVVAFLVTAFLMAGGLAYAVTEGEVAGAGPFTEPPTPTPTLTPTPRPSVSSSTIPTPTPTPTPTPATSQDGLLEWVMTNLLWLGIAALVIIIFSIYLSRRNKNNGIQGPPGPV